jgi:hypothetical protein
VPGVRGAVSRERQPDGEAATRAKIRTVPDEVRHILITKDLDMATHDLLSKPHALGRSERRLVLGMHRPLHAPKPEPAAAPGRRTGQFKAVVQEEAYGVVGHVGAPEFGEYDYPCHLYDSKVDTRRVATYETFDLREDRVESREVEREPEMEIGMALT